MGVYSIDDLGGMAPAGTLKRGIVNEGLVLEDIQNKDKGQIPIQPSVEVSSRRPTTSCGMSLFMCNYLFCLCP